MYRLIIQSYIMDVSFWGSTSQEIENGMVEVNYIRTLHIDEPLARIESEGTIRYYHADALGSIIALTDDIGQIRLQLLMTCNHWSGRDPLHEIQQNIKTGVHLLW